MDPTTTAFGVYGALLVGGLLYLLIGILTGSLEIGGDATLELPETSTDAAGIGCNVIAVFCTGAGAVGLAAALAGSNLLLTILLSLLAGLLVGRVFQKFLRFALRQQSNALLTRDDLIGLTARITVNIPASQTGEAIIEEGERMKYAVRHEAGLPLPKGTRVRIVDVQAGRLLVTALDEPPESL